MIKILQKIFKYLKISRRVKIQAILQATLVVFSAFLPTFVFAGVLGLIDFATSPLTSIANLLIYGIYSLITFILGGLVNLSASFMEWSLKLTMTSPEGIINVGWRVSLGLANNLFILIFLAIAIGTILGLPQINKKLLPMFLMVALLINFSMVIGNIVIDASNVLALSFLNDIQSKGVAVGDQLMNSMQSGEIQKQLNSVVNGNKELETEAQKAKEAQQETAKNCFATGLGEIVCGDSTGQVTETHIFNGITSSTVEGAGVVLLKSIYIIFIQLVIIITFLFGGIYLLSRTFWLWLLLMLAPLAWIAKLIPKANKYWDDWWSTFLAKAFFAPVYLFMVFLAVRIAKASGNALSGVLSKEGGGISASALIQMLTVAFMMLAGIHFGQKAGGGFANGIIKYGKGLGSRYGKELNKLRSKGFFEKQLEKIKPEALAKYTALGISKVPGASKIAGFTPERIEATRLKDKYAKLKEESEGYMFMKYETLEKEIINMLNTGTNINPAKIKAFQERAKFEGSTKGLEENIARELNIAARASILNQPYSKIAVSILPSTPGPGNRNPALYK